MAQKKIKVINNAGETGVLYLRYSSAGQTEQSIEGQHRVCMEFAQKRGIKIIDEYIDRAKTGTTDDRPAFQKMIRDAALGQFKYIIVYKFDRFMRDRYNSVYYKGKLKNDYGVTVLSAMEAISDDPAGQMIEALYECWGEMYSVDLSQKVKRGLRESAIKGTFTGANLLYGYCVKDKRVEVDERTAPAVRHIFNEYAKGTPKKQIVDWLNAHGYLSYTGKQFSINSLQGMLKNKKYIGQNFYGGFLYENAYPGIIAEATFEKVQAQLAQKRRAPGSGKAKEEYLLQGKLFCGHCGTQMVGVSGTSKTGGKHYYYVCSKRYKEKACNKAYEKKGFLEWYIVEQTVQYVLAPERQDIIAAAILKSYETDINAERVRALEGQQTQIDKELDKIVATLIKASIEDSATETLIKGLNLKSRSLEVQRDDLALEIKKLRLLLGSPHTAKDIKAWLQMFTRNFAGFQLEEEYQKRIIKIFVNSVYLWDDKLIIYYNLDGGKQVGYLEALNAIDDITLDEPPDCENSNDATLAPSGAAGSSYIKPIAPPVGTVPEPSVV